MLVPSEDLLGPAHDLVGVSAEEVLASSVELGTSSFSWQLRVTLCGSHLTAMPFIQKLSTTESTCKCLNEHDHQRSDPGAREAQFVRYSHQQLDGSWIVVDVSVDELRQFHRPFDDISLPKMAFRMSLIRDIQNGSSLVTWVENVDVREKEDEMHAILKPFVSLVLHSEKLWRSRPNKRRGDLGKPHGLQPVLQAARVELISSHNRVFDYLRDIQKRPQWEHLPLMPFGFSILPNVSGSILDGTLLTMVFQIMVKNVSSKQAVEVVTQIVKKHFRRSLKQ
ncbi:hypothetical protein M0R45_016834 [Rubus argutus]|uniref:START domain-containing protein n=1 Tax=Rubus argutus TaxID=59490 RepID=A0AAW1XUN9_RUBAR